MKFSFVCHRCFISNLLNPINKALPWNAFVFSKVKL